MTTKQNRNPPEHIYWHRLQIHSHTYFKFYVPPVRIMVSSSTLKVKLLDLLTLWTIVILSIPTLISILSPVHVKSEWVNFFSGIHHMIRRPISVPSSSSVLYSTSDLLKQIIFTNFLKHNCCLTLVIVDDEEIAIYLMVICCITEFSLRDLLNITIQLWTKIKYGFHT